MKKPRLWYVIADGGRARFVERDEDGAFRTLSSFVSTELHMSAHELGRDRPARVKESRRKRLMALQKRIVQSRQAACVGTRVRLLVDGPSSEHELVLRARLESQAPEIDPSVYLTDCDPAAIPTGAFVDAEIVSSHEYDLIARPVSVA